MVGCRERWIMKKIKFYCGTGFVGATHEEIEEFEDDATKEVIDECFHDWCWENLDAYWEEVE